MNDSQKLIHIVNHVSLTNALPLGELKSYAIVLNSGPQECWLALVLGVSLAKAFKKETYFCGLNGE